MLEAEFSVNPAARQEYYDRLALSMALEAEAGAASETGKSREYLLICGAVQGFQIHIPSE